MKQSTLLWLLGLGVLAVALKNKSVSGMQDPETSFENIQRGVANGWYTCEKLLVDGNPAVRLSGKVTNGKQFTDVYPVSWETYNKL